MKKLFNRVLSAFLVMALVMTGFFGNAGTVLAVNDRDVQPKEEQNGNTVSDILSNELAKSQEHESDKFYISDITVKEKVAKVVCQTIEKADLVVAVYEEQTGKMTASGTLRINPDEKCVYVELEGDIPEYYIVKGYLADTISHSPLCESYSCELYTEEMQQIIASSVYDYDSERVVNFDGDSKNNFAVYKEGVIVVKQTSWENIVSEEGSGNYIIEYPSEEVINLKTGDILAVEKEDGSIVIISAGTVSVRRNLVIIEDAGDLESRDVFEVVKVDTECNTSEMSVDTTNMDEELTYEGIYDSTELDTEEQKDNNDENASDIQSMALDGTAKLAKSIKYSVSSTDIKKVEESDTVATQAPGATSTPSVTPEPDDDGGLSFTASGSLTLSISGDISAYISCNYKYVSVVVTGSVATDIVFRVAFDKTFELGKVIIPTYVPGVNVTFTPAVDLSASGELSFNGTLYTAIGGAYDSNAGFLNKSTAPTIKGQIQVKAVVSLGLSGKLAVEVIDDCICEIALTSSIAAELSGSDTLASTDDSTEHECGVACIDGDINVIADITAKASIGPKEVSVTLINLNFKLCDFYYSIAHNEFGWGICPYIAYKVSVKVRNVDKSAVSGAIIGGTGLDPAPVTDASGSAEFYLKNGTYAITASNADKYGRNDIVVSDKSTGCTIEISSGTDITKQMKLFGDAEEEADGSIRLTRCETWSGGCVWYPNGIDTTKGFAVFFSYKAGGGRADSYGGADGIVLDFATKTGIGDEGGNMGFVDGYGLELDSYPGNSNDPDGKHISVVRDRVSNHINYVLDDRVDDGSWHDVEVYYQRDSEVFSVYLDNALLFCCPDVVMKNMVYMGLTAATGSGRNYHYVRDFVITAGDHDITVMKYGATAEYEEDSDITASSLDGDYSIIQGVHVGNEEVKDNITTVKFDALEAGESYLLVDALDTSLDNIFAADNLLYIEQGKADENGELSFSFIPKNELNSSVRLYGASKLYADSVTDNRPVIGGGVSDNKPADYHPIIYGNTGNGSYNYNNSTPLNVNGNYSSSAGSTKKAQSIKVKASKNVVKKSSIGKKGKKVTIKLSGKIKGKITYSCAKKYVKIKKNKTGKKATVTISKKARKGKIKILVNVTATNKYKRAKATCIIVVK